VENIHLKYIEMKKNAIFTTLCFVIFSLSSFSQQIGHADLDINNVRARFNSCGNNFWDLDSASHYEVPKDSGITSIYSQALWIGGEDINGQLKLAGDRYYYNGKDFWPGPISNTYDTVYDAEWNKVWKINKSSIDSFKLWYNNPSAYPNYIIPSEILSWPAHGDVSKGQSANLAPFNDNNNDGLYNPSNGDYPIIKGDQSVFYIYNDGRNIHTQTSGAKLYVELHVMAYAFDCPGALENTVFTNYKIYNRSTDTLVNTSIGVFTDFDLGYAYDDFIACDIQRGTYYCYNGNNIDGTGQTNHYGIQPPAQGVTILGGPYMDFDGMDNPTTYSGNLICDVNINGLNFNDGIPDNERLGLTKFMHFSNFGVGHPAMGDPQNSTEYYKYLNGFWKDSTHILYGGNGHASSSPPGYGPACNFMFPGDTDPCNWGTAGIPPNGPVYWTEETAGNTAYDRRGLGVSGFFTFSTGIVYELDLAMVWARADTGGPFASVQKMKLAIDSIRYYFINDSTPCGGNFTNVPYIKKEIKQGFIVFPNPSTDNITIKQTSNSNLENYEIYDMLGKSVMTGKLKESTVINIELLPDGLYFIKAFNENNCFTKKLIKH